MHDLDVKLHEAENFSNQWKPVHIDMVQDQSDNMKVMYIRNIAICGSAVHRSRRAGAGAGVLTYFAGAGAGVCSPPVKL